jgi:hypothetical protein
MPALRRRGGVPPAIIWRLGLPRQSRSWVRECTQKKVLMSRVYVICYLVSIAYDPASPRALSEITIFTVTCCFQGLSRTFRSHNIEITDG